MDQCGQGIEAQHYLYTMQQKASGQLYKQNKDVAVFRALLVNAKVCSRLNFLSRLFLVYTDGLHTIIESQDSLGWKGPLKVI